MRDHARPCVPTHAVTDRRRASLRAKFGSSQAELTPLVTEDGRERGNEPSSAFVRYAPFSLNIPLHMIEQNAPLAIAYIRQLSIIRRSILTLQRL